MSAPSRSRLGSICNKLHVVDFASQFTGPAILQAHIKKEPAVKSMAGSVAAQFEHGVILRPSILEWLGRGG